MNEEKKLSEQELGQVAGGAGDRDAKYFEKAWAVFEQEYCSRCANAQFCSENPGWRDKFCKSRAAEIWYAIGPIAIHCPNYSARR